MSAEVESHGLGAEDGGEDAGGAGEASGFACGECLVGVEVGCFHRAGEDGVVDGDHHGGGGLGVQVVGGEVLEELGEREAAAVPPVERTVLLASSLAHPSGCGHRVDDLAEHRRCQGGDGEVSGGGAVAVVVQRQRALCPGGLLLAADELVLVGVHNRLVGFDGLDGAAGEAAELVGAEPGRLLHECLPPRPGAAQRSRVSGSCPVARTITAACSGETRPASSASAVASCPESSSPPARPAGLRRRGTRWWSSRARRRHR